MLNRAGEAFEPLLLLLIPTYRCLDVDSNRDDANVFDGYEYGLLAQALANEAGKCNERQDRLGTVSDLNFDLEDRFVEGVAILVKPSATQIWMKRIAAKGVYRVLLKLIEDFGRHAASIIQD